MSRCIDLFIRPIGEAMAPPPGETIAARCALEASPEGSEGATVLRSGAVAAVLRANTITRAEDLVLGRYPWRLTATVESASGHLGDMPETRMLRSVSAALSSDHEVLLVLDLQYRGAAGADPAAGVPGDEGAEVDLAATGT